MEGLMSSGEHREGLELRSRAAQIGVIVKIGWSNLGYWCILRRGDNIRISSRGESPEAAFEDAADQMIESRLADLKMKI